MGQWDVGVETYPPPTDDLAIFAIKFAPHRSNDSAVLWQDFVPMKVASSNFPLTLPSPPPRRRGGQNDVSHGSQIMVRLFRSLALVGRGMG